MKGRKYQAKNSKNFVDITNNKKIIPSVNVLSFGIENNQNNNNNNYNFNDNFKNKYQVKNVRNLSQKPLHRPNNNYANNHNKNINNKNKNNINNNIYNNFMVINSNPFAVNQNISNSNRNPKLLPININPNLNSGQKKFIYNKNNKAKSKEPTKIKSKISNRKDNNNDKIKIKLDQKGVYICDDDEYEEDPNDVVNNLNNALKHKNENNLRMSQEEKTMIETIKKVSTNRVKYRKTHQMLREIGKIMNDPVVNFLIKKEPVGQQNDSPSDKLSSLLSQKLLEEKKRKLLEDEKEKEKNEEEQYYENLQKKIKDEIRKGKSFDFNKLSDKDRKILAERKLYNKMGKKNNEEKNKINNNNIINENYNDINNNLKNEEFNQKIDKQIKNEINREIKKENFLQEIEKYNDEEDDNFNVGKINNKELDENIENNEINKEKEKPTARGILEKVLNKIEYKNQQLINHNEEIANIKMKNENKKKFLK